MFLGIWLLVVALVGLASGFVSALGGVVMLGLDALSVLFAFAGGVVGCFFVWFSFFSFFSIWPPASPPLSYSVTYFFFPVRSREERSGVE